MDLLSDWFNELKMSNESVKDERKDMVPSLAVPTPVVELIFLKCLLFDQPDEVRYLSVELFDRFMRLHFKDVLAKVWNRKSRLPSEEWKEVERKVHIQAPLRMLSCIQIASKFVIHSKILRPKEIQQYLKAEKKLYTLSQILASEIRVWKTLGLRVNIATVLTHADLILEQLKLISHARFLPEDVCQRVVLFIDVVYLHHQEIYRKLFYLSTGRWEATPKEKQEFLPIECNVLYQAAAVVALSVTFTSRHLDDDIYEQLGQLTNIPSEDIHALANVINQIVLS